MMVMLKQRVEHLKKIAMPALSRRRATLRFFQRPDRRQRNFFRRASQVPAAP